MEMGTSGLLIFYGSYFLLSALLFASLYLFGKQLVSRTGWIILGGAILLGALFPFFMMLVGLGLSLALYMLLTCCIAWMLGKSSAEVKEESIGSSPDLAGPQIHLPLQIQSNGARQKVSFPQAHVAFHEQAAADDQFTLTEREPDGIDSEHAELQMTDLLSFDEVAVSLEENSSSNDLTEQAEAPADSLLSEDEETIHYDFEEEETDRMPADTPIGPTALPRKEEPDTEEEDQIIYVFDDEPRDQSLKPQDTSQPEADSSYLEENEWNFVSEDQK